MRRAFLLWAAATFVCASLLGWLFLRPESARPVTIGVLLFTDTNLTTLEGFRQGLAELGLRDGDNVRYVFPGPALTQQELEGQAEALMARRPDLIFASPTPAALAAKTATADAGAAIPIVFAPVNDPVASGVVRDPLRPEANITGVRLAQSDDKRLQCLLDVAPHARRVLVPYNPEDPSAKATLAVIMNTREQLGVEIVAQPFRATDRVDAPDFLPPGVQAVFLPRDGLVLSRIDDFIALCIARRIPLSTPRKDQVQRGALTGYGLVGHEIGRQAARMAHLLLSGAPVSSIPVETARDYLFINLDTARRMGLSIPEAVLRRAQYVAWDRQ